MSQDRERESRERVERDRKKRERNKDSLCQLNESGWEALGRERDTERRGTKAHCWCL